MNILIYAAYDTPDKKLIPGPELARILQGVTEAIIFDSIWDKKLISEASESTLEIYQV